MKLSNSSEQKITGVRINMIVRRSVNPFSIRNLVYKLTIANVT
ncbi:PHIKZ024.2 [Pseudomonas phage phiKZ]|uniref:PHIKZ024.2 n=1 Tax=Pseudomonas phage phiKZ TaxID=2905945 RepID=L7SYZ7_BPDPK|nr:PHIKZ024.2 [Pseudomonas phage phiKZ]AGC26306.1 PHIKZ024.2 [Pseudomonas phage phiKZ]